MAIEKVIYYGDCLEILRNRIPDSSVDLVYLDPPWKSDRPYNIIFREPSGELPEAQVQVFDDTWHWTIETERNLQQIIENAPYPVVKLIKSFLDFLGRNDITAYLVMICPRLLQVQRVMKDDASLFFHCNPVISHYIKIMLDCVFGKENYRNEIVWCYTGREHPKTKVFPWRHQTLFFYTKSDEYKKKFKPIFRQYDQSYINLYFNHTDTDGRIYQQQSNGKGGYYKQYLDRSQGIRIPDWWEQKRDGIKPIHGKDMYTMHKEEEYFYPTQKPVKLLELIIKSATDIGDTVLDPFCGCGTSLIASEQLSRKWIGIDVTYCIEYDIIGEPIDFSSAAALARDNRRQFRIWAVSKVGGRASEKESWDRGIDGYCFFPDRKEIREALVQVKSGDFTLRDVRDFCHVVERENSDAGIIITLKEPTSRMEKEAATKGFFIDAYGNEYPKIQILTISSLLRGKTPELPPLIPPYEFRAIGKREKGKQTRLIREKEP